MFNNTTRFTKTSDDRRLFCLPRECEARQRMVKRQDQGTTELRPGQLWRRVEKTQQTYRGA